MAQQGMVQDLARSFGDVYSGKKFKDMAVSAYERATRKADPSWHAKMVAQANDSFRKKANKHKVGGSGSKITSARKAKGAPKPVAKNS